MPGGKILVLEIISKLAIGFLGGFSLLVNGLNMVYPRHR